MNGTQIMNQVITYETSELSNIKSQMASFLDILISKIAPAKEQGIGDSDIKAGSDMMIRKQMRHLLNGKDTYMVQRNGQAAMLGIDAPVVNAIVNLFEKNI